MKRMKSLFECTAAERRGMIVLAILVLLMLAARILLMLLPPRPLPPLEEEEYRQYLAFEERQRFLSDSLDSVWDARRQYRSEFKYRQSRNYYQREKHWTAVPALRQQNGFVADSVRKEAARKYPEKRTLQMEPVDLNRADTILLRTIPGIGMRTAKEIVAYRERLGGFCDFSQLLEIRFIDSARWQQVLPYLALDTMGTLRKLRINQANVNELVKHPYIDYYLAKTIVVWRENKGRFRSLEEFRSATRIYSELYEKLKPYLTVK